MGDLVRLTEVNVRPKVVDSMHREYTVIEVGPVWVNPLGVNVVAAHLEAEATSLRMDCGQNITVRETAAEVAELIDRSNREDFL